MIRNFKKREAKGMVERLMQDSGKSILAFHAAILWTGVGREICDATLSSA